MSTKTLKISEKKALELYKKGTEELKEILEESFGKNFFNKNITDRVYNLDTLFEYLDIEPEKLLIYNEKTISSFEKYINACVIIPKIVKIYNEGTILDWTNASQYKYLPYIRKVGSTWVAGSSDGWAASALGPFAHHFKSRDLSDKALSNFNQIYLDYYTYNG